SARPRFTRLCRYSAAPGPRVTGLRSTVRAPDITASAVMRSSIICSLSRLLLNEEDARLAVAILPSAVIARFRKTKGSFIRSHNQHRIAIAEETVTLGNSLPISGQDQVASTRLSGRGKS